MKCAMKPTSENLDQIPLRMIVPIVAFGTDRCGALRIPRILASLFPTTAFSSSTGYGINEGCMFWILRKFWRALTSSKP